MSYDSRNKPTDKTEDKISLWDRIIHGKGTVAEPWPTVQEVLSDEKVKKEIKKVEDAFEAIDRKMKA